MASGNNEVADKIKKLEAMVYAHITELEKNGYITKDMKISDAGRICVL